VCRVDVQTVRLLVLKGWGVKEERLRALQQEIQLLAGITFYCAACLSLQKMAKC
jgi:hypothetical protein